MTPKYCQICDDPQKISTKSSYPKKYSFFSKPQKNIEIQNFEPPKMTQADACMKISEYPPPLPQAFSTYPGILIPVPKYLIASECSKGSDEAEHLCL